MNWPRTIMDGIVMALLFNAVVGVGFLLYPQAYSTMFPKEIKEAAAPFVDPKQVKKMKLIIYPLYLLMPIYWAISGHMAGVNGFWSFFWTGYVEMTLVSLGDFLILDCWLPPYAKSYIEGADHCKAWRRKEWLLKLAIPEHGLAWTFIMCPLTGFMVAGIGMLL